MVVFEVLVEVDGHVVVGGIAFVKLQTDIFTGDKQLVGLFEVPDGFLPAVSFLLVEVYGCCKSLLLVINLLRY